MMASKMNENTKRILIILCLFIILFFVFMGALATAVQSLMKKQGSKADEMLANVTKVDYFKKESQYKRFAIKKNIRLFYRQARIPFLVIVACALSYVLYCLFGGAPWGYNPFNRVDGFGSILIRFGEFPKEKFFGIKLISGFPNVISKPHFEWSAWFSYLFVPINVIGIIWFLIYTQAYISRSIRIYAIARGIYRKKLVPDETPVNPASPAAPENSTNNDSTLSS